MRFELTLVEPDGSLARRLVDAASPQAAMASCGPAEQVIDCRGRERGGPAKWGRRRELLGFCEALEQVLSGGLTLSESLRALAADGDNRGAVFARAILRELDNGLAPSDAFEATGLGWSPFLIALIRSGERSGQLEQAFGRFTVFEKSLLEMRGKVVSASIYPLVLLGVSMLVMLFLMGFVVPRFAAALDDMRTEIPAGSRIILESGRWLGDNLGLVAGPALIGLLALVAIAALPATQQQCRKMLSRLPGVRDIAELAGRAQALRVTAALLAGGATVPVAFAVARETSGELIGARLTQATERVERGEPPSQALAQAGLAGSVAVQLLTAAERTGGLAPCFERLALADEARLSRSLERLTSAWGPLLLVGVAAMVGCVVVALYWPMLQVFESVR
jgi:general secretion pathway protein F